MKKLIFLAALLGTFNAAKAQSYTIQGRVLDHDTQEGIPFCNVFLAGTTIGTTTDLDGFYTLTTAARFDSLSVSAIGYGVVRKALQDTTFQKLDFHLLSAGLTFEEVVVYAGENPANRIVRQIIEHRVQNRLDAAENYECEDYTKVELDFENLDPHLTDTKLFQPFEFIFENVDSLSDEQPFLPIFIKETLSDVLFTKASGKTKNRLKAQKETGVGNQTILEFLDRMHQPYDVYDNWIKILEKSFASPFSNLGLFYYEYYIEDSTHIEGKWCYNLRFKPKRRQENTFYGDFWVADTSFAVVRVNMRMSPQVNLNFVDRILIFEEYHLENQRWVVAKKKMVLDFTASPQSAGLIGRKTASFRKYRFNDPDLPPRFERLNPEKYDIEDLRKDDAFWQNARHDTLSTNEAGIYTMIDSIKKVPIFKTYSKILEGLTIGYIEISPLKKNGFGPVKMGPYFYFYNFNPIEGNRFQLGGQVDWRQRTLRTEAYLGYGTKDRDFKYGLKLRWKLQERPRMMLGVAYTNDIITSHRSSEDLVSNNFFSGTFRRNIPLRMLRAHEGKIFLQKYWTRGWSNRITVLNRFLDPYGGGSSGFNFAYLPDLNDPTRVDTTVHTTEFIFKTRYAYQEKRIDGNFDYFTFGSSKFPILELTYTAGVRGILKSDFNYHKLTLSLSHWFYVNPIGWHAYRLEVGRVFGVLPSLLLEVHQGNESFFHDPLAFNTMNRYEFTSDLYVAWKFEHHFDGYLLNKIPLLRKLDWRALVSFRGVWGRLSPENLAHNRLNSSDFGGTLPFRAPTSAPFMEAGVGIENIFKVFQIHAIWRLNYLDNPEAYRFMLQGGLYFAF